MINIIAYSTCPYCGEKNKITKPSFVNDRPLENNTIDFSKEEGENTDREMISSLSSCKHCNKLYLMELTLMPQVDTYQIRGLYDE